MDVAELFQDESNLTRVCISGAAAKALAGFQATKENPSGALLKKLHHWAKNGFWNYEAAEGPIRHESDGVYRLGIRLHLYRLIGFYADDDKHVFIIADAYLKKGQKLSGDDRKRIRHVATCKRDRLWRLT